MFNRAGRIEEGKRIAKNLGLPIPDYGQKFAAELEKVLPSASDEHLASIEATQADHSEPDNSYIMAKLYIFYEEK